MVNTDHQKIKILSAPDNWEVIQHTDGFADFGIRACLEADPEDDTRLSPLFDISCVYVRLVDESDGNIVIPEVQASFSGAEFTAVLKAVPAGGPYTLDFVCFDRESCVYYPLRGERRYHLFVGDVYVIAGQSNAAGMGMGCLEDAPEIGISLMRNLSSWDIASVPFNTLDYAKHTLYMAFAKKMKKDTGYPVGLIPCAIGGAPLSRWLLSEDGDLMAKTLKAVGDRKVKALLWYQGCTDAGDGVSTDAYCKRFERFVCDVRESFKSPELPIFTFQLNRQCLKDPNESLDRRYDDIREAQRLCALKIPGVYILPAIDGVHMSDFIHLSRTSNVMLGQRLALQAQKVLYNHGKGVYAPSVEEIVITSPDTIKIRFGGVLSFLYDCRASLDRYPIIVEDSLGRVELKQAALKGSEAELVLTRGLKGNAYVSCHGGTDPANLITDYATGIPALCFRIFIGEN